jgi:hypothetical protein
VPARRPTPTPAGGQAIEAALQEVAARLQAGDLSGAVAAVDRVSAACQASAGGGLDEVTRTRLQPLVERCVLLASNVSSGLAAALAQLGAGNRAHRAYNAD